MKKPLKPGENIKQLGIEWTFQGVFPPEELTKTAQNWKGYGHSTMIKKGGNLYVSRYKTRK